MTPPTHDGDRTTEATAGVGRSDVSPAFSTPSMGELARGTQIDRYLVTGKLGEGGMGVVYRAYDPELDRRLAIKLLRTADASASSEASSRIVREAQALAKLSHPNVVALHDVGVFSDSVYLAMELVEGQTLAGWISDTPRSRAEIIGALVDAGRGLLAAHDKGLVHRDLKPSNIMVADDGRVRVMDFGLARAATREDLDAPTNRTDDEPFADALATDLTRDGATLGTPGYMPPEQIIGGPIDVRTDVFSFCATTWRALYGQLPYGKGTVLATRVATLDGRLTEPPKSAGVPTWMRRVLERGLAPDANLRWPSMHPLLAALERKHSRTRWALGSIAVVGLAVTGAVSFAAQRRAAACEAAQSPVDEVWSASTRQRVREGLERVAPAHAERTWQGLDQRLGDWSDAWRTQREAACPSEDTDPAERARRIVCLEDQLGQLRGLVGVLETPTDNVAREALPLATTLPDPERCEDGQWLAAATPLPADASVATAVAEVRQQLARISALTVARELEGLVEDATAQRDRAQSLGFAPLLADATRVLGLVYDAKGEYPQAKTQLVSAFVMAAEADAPQAAANTSIALAALLGVNLGRPREGVTWATVAEGYVTRLGTAGRLIEARRVRALADIARIDERMEEALDLAEQAHAIAQEVLPSNDPMLGIFLEMRASILQQSGRLQAARPLLEQSLETAERAFGPQHPRVADAAHTLGIVHARLGELGLAKASMQRALHLRERLLEPDHPRISQLTHNLANLARMDGDLDGSRALYLRTIEGQKLRFGDDHPRVAGSYESLGLLEIERGELESALELMHKTLRITEAHYGPEHPSTAKVLVNLSNVHHAAGRAGEQRAVLLRAKTILESQTERSMMLIPLLENLANVELLHGDPTLVGPYVAQALELVEARGEPDDATVAGLVVLDAAAELKARRLTEAEAKLDRAQRLASAANELDVLSATHLARADLHWLRQQWQAAHDSAATATATAAKDDSLADRRRAIERWRVEHPLPPTAAPAKR